MNTRPCNRCEFHKSKSNPNKGKLIPGYHGKCTRPEGLCSDDEIADTEMAAAEMTRKDEEVAKAKWAAALNVDGASQPEAAIPQVEAAETVPSPVIPEITTERGAELEAGRDMVAAVDQAVMDAYDVAKSVGQIEGIDFTRRVGDAAIAQIFSEVRNSKKYKGLPYKDDKGITRRVGTFEEFCQVFLGRSYNRCLELSQNLRMLGQDLYNSAQKIGFRAKDYRTLKALPEAEQEIIKEAIQAEDKDQVLDLLTDMAERHASERAAVEKETKDLKADLKARDKLLTDKTQKLDAAALELEKFKSLPADENVELKLAREEKAVKELGQAQIGALAELNKLLMQVDAIITSDDIAQHTKQYAVQTIQAYCVDIQANLANYGIPVDFEEMINPEWMREAAKADHENGDIGNNGAW